MAVPSKPLPTVFAETTRPRDATFHVRAGEDVADGIRRVAREQLEDARDELSHASRRGLPDAVHETRKRIKRARASVRLARDAVGDPTYERENAALRRGARRLAAGRDAQVLLDTLDDLAERFAHELGDGAIDRLRARLDDERRRAQRELGARAQLVAQAMDEAGSRSAGWTFERDGFDAVAPGLRRIYRRGRKRMRAAVQDPSPEHLHEWRKRVKDLWHATQILEQARPKRMRRLSKRAHKLADLLGDGHDLSMLDAYVREHPRCFDDEASRQALLAVIERRAKALRKKALARGRKLYKRSPKRFAGEIERGWRKRTRQHAAG